MDVEPIDEPEVADVRIPMTKVEFLRWNPDDGFLYEYDGEYAEQNHAIEKYRPLPCP